MASSLTNISQWLSGGFERVQIVLSTSGRPYGTLPSAGNNSGMTIVKGANAANITFPQADILQIPGDNGVRGAIQFAGNALPTFDLTFADLTGTFIDTAQGTTEIDAQSVYDWFTLDPADRAFPDIFMMLTSRAYSTIAGSEGNGYDTVVFPLCTVGFQGPGAKSTGANTNLNTFNVTVNRASVLPWGTPLTTATHGTTGASGWIFFSEQIPTFDIYRQDNSSTSFTPTQAINANAQVIAWDGAALGTPSTLAVTESSGDITFTAQANNNVTTTLYEVA